MGQKDNSDTFGCRLLYSERGLLQARQGVCHYSVHCLPMPLNYASLLIGVDPWEPKSQQWLEA